MTEVRAFYKNKPVTFLAMNKGRTTVKGEPNRESHHVRIQQGEDIVLLEVNEVDKVIRALTRAKNYVITTQKDNPSID